MKHILFALLLMIPMMVNSFNPPPHPVQPYVNYPQPGYYVLKNHDSYNAFHCWVKFPDGYILSFVLYPLVVSSPFPLITSFSCG